MKSDLNKGFFVKYFFAILLALTALACSKESDPERATPIFSTAISDTFSYSDGALSGQANWTVTATSGATADVTSQKVKLSQGSGASPAAMHHTLLNAVTTKISLDFSVTGGNISNPVAGLIARANTSNFSTVTSSYFCGFAGTSNNLILVRSGSTVQTGSATHSFNNGTQYKISFTTTNAGSLTCSISGSSSEELTYTDSSPYGNNYYYGMIGGVSGSDYLFVDNFLVEYQ